MGDVYRPSTPFFLCVSLMLLYTELVFGEVANVNDDKLHVESLEVLEEKGRPSSTRKPARDHTTELDKRPRLRNCQVD